MMLSSLNNNVFSSLISMILKSRAAAFLYLDDFDLYDLAGRPAASAHALGCVALSDECASTVPQT